MRAETHISYHVKCPSDCDESWNVLRNDEKSFQYGIVVTRGRTDGVLTGGSAFLQVSVGTRAFAFAQAQFRPPRNSWRSELGLSLVRPRTGGNARFVVLAAEFVKIQLFWDVTFVDWGFPDHQPSDALLTPLMYMI